MRREMAERSDKLASISFSEGASVSFIFLKVTFISVSSILNLVFAVLHSDTEGNSRN